jgi:hypothetical protein
MVLVDRSGVSSLHRMNPIGRSNIRRTRWAQIEKGMALAPSSPGIGVEWDCGQISTGQVHENHLGHCFLPDSAASVGMSFRRRKRALAHNGTRPRKSRSSKSA